MSIRNDWLWIGEDDDANIHWICGEEAEVREFRDDKRGLIYEGDPLLGCDVILASVGEIMSALELARNWNRQHPGDGAGKETTE